jgi:hypothetical protein
MTREIPESLYGDPAWAAVLHIFNSRMFVNSQAVWKHVDLQRRSIDFEEILKRGWSGGERRILRIAASLFNQDTEVNLWEGLGNIDEGNSQVVIGAISLFMGVEVIFP